jgi:hypothetical protein
MTSTTSTQRPTIRANITALLKELEELGRLTRPVEYQRPGQQSAVVITGK